MRKGRYSVLLICTLGVTFCTGCQSQQHSTPRQEGQGVPTTLSAAIDTFYTSIENDDIETRIALFADSAMMMPNHWTMSRGKDVIAAGIRRSAGSVFRIRDREIVDIDVSGDLAYTVNSYFYTWHPAGEEPQWHRTKNIHIWKRDAEGRWKLHADIWNSDVPISRFAEE